MNRRIWVIGLWACICSIRTLHAQAPVSYWTFDRGDGTKDEVGGKIVNVTNYKPAPIKGAAAKGNGWLGSGNAIILTNILKTNAPLGDFSIEFFFKGESFSFSTFPSVDFRFRCIQGAFIVDYTPVRKGKPVKEQWKIDLNGSGIGSYSNLANNEWHHIVLVMSKTGQLTIWIDGQTQPLLNKKIEHYVQLSVNSPDRFTFNGALDELAFYDKVLDARLIAQHHFEVLQGKSYSFEINGNTLQKAVSKQQDAGEGKPDPMEFAPGFPNYTIQAYEQLRSFPLPRYSKSKPLPRNFPWMDINYLCRELPGAGGKGFGKQIPAKAVAISRELAVNWNYFLEIPCFRVDSIAAMNRYTTGVAQALIAHANENAALPVATILFHVQNKPLHIGLAGAKPNVLSQTLPNKYYIRNASGQPVILSGKKWLSPLAPQDFIVQDGLNAAFYLKQLKKHLKRPFGAINENGEWFGHMRPASLLNRDPAIEAFRIKNGYTNEQLNGWMQNRFDSVYKATILREIGQSEKDLIFSFYNVSAYNPSYWPDYAMRIRTNSSVNGSPRSTPSFYPARPDNWRMSSGPLNGYGRVAEGRKREIELGVKFFSPFVAAGWSNEEKNIRPAQWLGLLKSMVMLGADFFYTGYFNVTGKNGKWPDGVGPYDPRGYAYQAVMPSYAQAVASYFSDFLEKGALVGENRPLPYNLSDNYGHLVMVRKLGAKYLIFGAVQPTSNLKGNAPIEDVASFNLDNKTYRIKIRRQGSMYLLEEKETGNPVISQLDEWHQYEHPYFWSPDLKIEAESSEEITNGKIVTDRNGKPANDFSDFVTFVKCVNGGRITFEVPEKRNTAYKCVVRIKGNREGAMLKISANGKSIEKITGGSGWTEISLSFEELQRLAIKKGSEVSLSGSMDIDWVKF
ncbi:LamG domain-containing protein [Parasegetibacter sp. NRK P23]|uniref:LamG domain-containing protein n=1 Tax=Parasegetibacter sp. NRK P23 TaxID=2942999 RepID=UPI00204385E3|nr:LamG domain-containing protein [Parasegetibacter sp. NRK P23]MCM5527628.1 LamG domain-containing protein [Parasegetibacter sp. NRK P23]